MSVVLGILVILALALVGGRVVQNVVKQRTANQVTRNNTQQTPAPTLIPIRGEQEVLSGQTGEPQAAELPAAGSPLGLLSLAVFAGAGTAGFILRRIK